VNQNFFTFTASTSDPTSIRSEYQFNRGAVASPQNPIEDFMSNTARDSLGFPTKRDIIDAEYENLPQGQCSD